jgi:hypothetical protein
MPRFSSHKRSAARSKLRIRASVPGAGMAVFEVAIVAPEDCCAFRRALPRHLRRADLFLAAERPFSVPFTGMVLCQPVVTSKPHPMARARACHRKFRQDRQTFRFAGDMSTLRIPNFQKDRKYGTLKYVRRDKSTTKLNFHDNCSLRSKQ